jgi:hypothetical protein
MPALPAAARQNAQHSSAAHPPSRNSKFSESDNVSEGLRGAEAWNT